MSQNSWKLHIRGYSPDFPYHLFSTFDPISARLISGPNQCVILADTYSMEIRVNSWISPANVCLLKDQVKTIINPFFEIGTITGRKRPIKMISAKHLSWLFQWAVRVRTTPAGYWFVRSPFTFGYGSCWFVRPPFDYGSHTYIRIRSHLWGSARVLVHLRANFWQILNF